MRNQHHDWTLDTVRGRCIDDGDCWMWQQSVNSGGHPQASIFGFKSKLVRRFVFETGHGPLLPGYRVLSLCENPTCCNPEHLTAMSASDAMKSNHARGVFSIPAYTAGRAAAMSKRPGTKIGYAAAEQIRIAYAAGATDDELALQYGVNLKTIFSARTGRTWRPPVANSAFTWRPA